MHGSDGQNRLEVNSFTEHLTTLDHTVLTHSYNDINFLQCMYRTDQ